MSIRLPNFIFRMTHLSNVSHALQNGLWTKGAPNANTNYESIGDSSIISSRTAMPVNVPPGGTMADYIPFYFGARSPMLYVIKNGYNFVKKTRQSEIVYLVVPYSKVLEHGLKWFFTDGNARDYSSQHFSSESDFGKLDWDTIMSQDWANSEDDRDRKRRKQAEFLIYQHVPASCFSHIIAYDSKTANIVASLVKQLGLNVTVKASPKHYY